MLNIGQRVAIINGTLRGYTGVIVDIEEYFTHNIYWVELDNNGGVIDLFAKDLTKEF